MSLAANNICVFEWPPYSPDLSPIEHLWELLDRRVRRRNPPPASIPELRQALQDEWQAIPIQTINNLVGSMTRRICGAIAVNGFIPDTDFTVEIVSPLSLKMIILWLME